MKKFYALAFAAIAALSANADNMQFTVHGQPVQNGDRINITDMFEAEPITQYNPELKMVPSVSGDITVVCDFYKDNTTPKLDNSWDYGASMSVAFCAINSSCLSIDPGTSRSKTGDVSAGVEYDMRTELVMNLGYEESYENIKVDCEFSVEATLQGETVKLVFYANTTDAHVEGLTSDFGEAVYFDLQGHRVANPSHGIFIMRQNGKSQKVIL